MSDTLNWERDKNAAYIIGFKEDFAIDWNENFVQSFNLLQKRCKHFHNRNLQWESHKQLEKAQKLGIHLIDLKTFSP